MMPGDWIPIRDAGTVIMLELKCDKPTANSLLLTALRAGKIDSHGKPIHVLGQLQGYRNIHLKTDDFMKWLYAERVKRTGRVT